MNLTQFVKDLLRQSITVSAHDGVLKVNAPKGGMTEEIKQLLKQHKAALLELFQENGEIDFQEPIESVDRTKPVVLSHAQKSLWFIHTLDPKNSKYNTSVTLELKGGLDAEALKYAFDEVMFRHESLRTRYQENSDGEPVQRVRNNVKVPSKLKEIAKQGNWQAKLSTIINEEQQRPFDLRKEPLIRLLRVRVEEQLNYLVVTLHHIASDGWSTGILVSEVSQLYRSYLTANPPELPRLTTQYADYAVWQNNYLNHNRVAYLKKFWLKYLADIPLVHSLPLDNPRSGKAHSAMNNQSEINKSATETRNISGELYRQFKRACSDHDVTVFMAVHGLFSQTLSAFSGQSDIVIGTPIANRHHPQIANLIGFFANSVVLRTRVTPSWSFTDLLRESKSNCLKVFKHQQLPFEMLVDALNPRREININPVFQVMLVLQNNERKEFVIDGLTTRVMEPQSGATKFDLVLNFTEESEGMTLRWEYNASLFSAQKISRLAQVFENLLTEGLQQPQKSLAEVSLCSPEELEKICTKFSVTAPVKSQQQSIIELFKQAVSKHSNETALLYQDTLVSYQQLDEISDELAHRLTEQGIEKDDIVGFLLPRGIYAIVTIIATLKCGAAYLPLPETYPESRLAYMVEDSGASLVITKQGMLAQHILAEHTQLMLLDDELCKAKESNSVLAATKATTERRHKPFVVARVEPRDLAYLIYTSGSTGKPKGVMLHHRGLLNLALAQSASFEVTANSKVLQFASIGFDAATSEWAMALSVGATLHLIPEDTIKSPFDLSLYVQRSQITHCTLPPALLPHLDFARWQSVSHLVVAGEACPINEAEKWAKGRTFYNAYGPSEVTVCASIAKYQNGVQQLHIGEPMAGTSTYILNEQMMPVPVGVAGEIVVGGLGVGLGYINNPQLTEQSFIHDPLNPFSSSASMMYRTGDMGYWNESGDIVFLGRRDSQLKIRGFRIESGEIEFQLRQYEAVKSAFVHMQELKPDQEKSLVAYIVLHTGQSTEKLTKLEFEQHVKQLKDGIRNSLPEFMVPARFVFCDKFSLTSNGKIDVRALEKLMPSALSATNTQGTPEISPANDTEKSVYKIWKNLLGLTAFNTDENFFDLGGHSLKVAAVINEIRSEFAVDVSIQSFFENPTVIELSQLVENLKANGAGASEQIVVLPPVVRTDKSSGDLLPSYGQQRFWFIDQFEGGSPQYNMVTSLTLYGDLDFQALESALTQVIERHNVLRSCFFESDNIAESGAGVKVVLAKATQFTPQYLDITDLSGEQQKQRINDLLADERSRTFDLGLGRLLAVTVAKVAQQEFLVLINMHHIASDGWSMSVFFNDLDVLYRNALDGSNEPLPTLPVDYYDFAAWQNSHLQGDNLNSQLSWWRDKLSGIPLHHSLPLDYERPNKPVFSGNSILTTLSPDMTVAIDAFCRDNDVTLFMFLQTAFALLMARIGQQNDVLMGTPVACRSDQKFDQLMGLFVNTVIIRTKISKVGFSELLKQQKQVLLASFARQNMPLDLIIEDLNPPRNSCYNPLFQVVFSLSNENQNQLALGDLEVEPYVETAGTCRFDLELYAERRSDMIGLRWNYNTSLFKLQSVENWSEYFYLLLQEILKDSDKNVNELNLVPAEQAPLIHQALNSRSMLNEGTLPKVDVNLFTQIQKTALKHPQAIALQNENESLTYEQMAKYTVAYSAWLSDKLDSREEQAIGLAVEDPLKRSLLMLSIAAAGHVFVPLEKAIRDKNSHLLRGSWALLDAVVRDTEFSEPVCLEIDNKRDIPELELPELPELTDSWLTNFIDSRLHGKKQDGTQLLCLLPDEKAQCWVPIEHHNVLAVIQQEAFPLTSLSEFSLYIGKLNQLDSLFAFWADLLRGACIQFCSQNPVSIQRVFETYKVAARGLSIVTSTAVLKQGVLSDYLASGAISELICSSQTSSEEGELLLPYVDKVDSLSLVLSPTQAGKYRLYQVAKKDQPGLHQIKLNAILKASNRYRDFYLLDENLQAVPVGVAGKIYKADCLFAEVRDVGSANTCQKVTVPFSPKELVATGEYALWQVTEPGIHLHKIPALPTIKRLISKQEMSDNLIAGALQISGVKDALLFEAGERTQKQYIALACDDVSAKHLGLVTVRLQKLLSRLKKETETDISVNGFLTLPEIPRTAENQTDLAELQKLSSDPISLSSKKAAKTALQKRMLGIWSDILKAEDFGIGDDFFQLGGHSLLATRLVCEIEQKLGYSVSLKELFENSTIDELCRLLDRRDPVAQKSAIVKTSNEGPFPLSYAQQRLWFIDKLEGGSPKYNIPFALKLQGELNIDALQTAINDLIQRHEILRTCYFEQDGIGYQKVQQTYHFELQNFQLSGEPSEGHQSELRQLIKDEARKAFHLESDLMLRAGLVKLSEHSFVLLLTIHHIAADGWSVGIMINEIGSTYNRLLRNFDEVELQPLPIQYADYAVWQRDARQQDLLAKQTQYWLKQLDALPEIHELPLDKSRPSVLKSFGKIHRESIPSDLATKFKSFCNQQDVTLFMGLYATLHTLLVRYSGNQDCVIGTPVANREQTSVQNLIGFFVNTLVLRQNMSTDCSFEQLLQNTRKICLEAYQNQQVSFESLVNEIQPDRSLSHAPLFQIMMVVQNKQKETVSFDNLSVSSLSVESGQTKYDLTITFNDVGDSINMGWEYNTDLFSAETIEQFSRHFQNLLLAAVDQPKQAINFLEFLSEEDKRVQLSACAQNQNADQLDFLASEVSPTVLCQIEKMVQSHSEKIAAKCSNKQISYAQLWQNSGALAQRLAEYLCDDEPRVAVSLSRSCDLLVTLLAIWRCGASYVPIDPEYPENKKSWIITDSKAQLYIHEQPVVDVVSRPDNSADIRRVSLNDLNLAQPTAPIKKHQKSYKNSHHSARPAYMIYTSGSTGTPKGVVVNHGNLTNYLQFAASQYVQQRAGTVVALSISFDATVTSLFSALLTGGQVLFGNEKNILFFLKEHLETTKQNWVYKVTPSHLEALSGILDATPTSCNNQHCFVVGGEALGENTTQQFMQHFSQSKLINEYGPTETTVGCTVFEWHSNCARFGQVPIGKPITKMQNYVLDDQQQLLPHGAKGELYIGGAGVSNGYFGRDDLTAERFVQLPHICSGMLYRSGDIVSLQADGNLLYWGRKDSQVKVRGYRIELAEIEFVLNKLEVVQQSAVVVHELSNGLKNIVAFCVTHISDEPLCSEEARSSAIFDELNRYLPLYMMPQKIYFIDSLPMTVNGKVSREALLNQIPSSVNDNYAPPENLVQEQLVTVYSEILKQTKIGVDDNYFAIGGDSIRIVQIINLLKRSGLYLNVKDIFSHQTIRQLANYIQKHQTELQKDNSNIPIQLAELEHFDSPEESAPVQSELGKWVKELLSEAQELYRVTPMQEMMLQHNLFGDVDSVYQPQMLFMMDEFSLNEVDVTRVITALLDLHPTLRTQFVKVPESLATDCKFAQIVHANVTPDIRHFDFSTMAEEQAEQLLKQEVFEDAAQRFDLFTDMSLIRFSFFNLPKGKGALCLSMHHIVEDGWGFIEFKNHLFASLENAAKGEPLSLPDETSTAFKEYVALCQEAMASSDSKLAWTESLKGFTAMLPLRVLPPEKGHKAEILTEQLELKAEVAQLIQELSQQHGWSIKSIYLYLYQQALMTQFGLENVIVESVTNGRSHRLTDPFSALGLFWTLQPIGGVSCNDKSLSRPQELAMINRRLQVSEQHNLYPASTLLQNEATKQTTWAGFNFVQFHNLESRNQTEKERHKLVFGRDHFHHHLKLTVSTTGRKDSANLMVDYNSHFITRQHVLELLQIIKFELTTLSKCVG